MLLGLMSDALVFLTPAVRGTGRTQRGDSRALHHMNTQLAGRHRPRLRRWISRGVLRTVSTKASTGGSPERPTNHSENCWSEHDRAMQCELQHKDTDKHGHPDHHYIYASLFRSTRMLSTTTLPMLISVTTANTTSIHVETSPKINTIHIGGIDSNALMATWRFQRSRSHLVAFRCGAPFKRALYKREFLIHPPIFVYVLSGDGQ